MQREPIKGPTTKLLQCPAIIIRPSKQKSEFERPQFEIYASTLQGDIISDAPLLKAIETTDDSETLLKKIFTCLDEHDFSMSVFDVENKGKASFEIPFFDIVKEKDFQSTIYQVISREKVGGERIGTIDHQLLKSNVRFEISGSESSYLIDAGRRQEISLESFICCGLGNKIYNSELTIYNNEFEMPVLKPRDRIMSLISSSKLNYREGIGKILKLKKRDPFSKYRDVFLSFPKTSYDEERCLLLALALLLTSKLFAK